MLELIGYMLLAAAGMFGVGVLIVSMMILRIIYDEIKERWK